MFFFSFTIQGQCMATFTRYSCKAMYPLLDDYLPTE